MSKLLRAFGIVLILGGVLHSACVLHQYSTRGVPELDRVLLHSWLAEAQILAGVFYLMAPRALRAGGAWNLSSVAAAVTLLTYAVPYIPVLFLRAPVGFRIAPIVYSALCIFILVRVG